MTKAWMVMVVALAGSIALADGPVVSVHLPRDTLVSPGPLSLGDICAIHCQDDETSRIAGATSMGRSPFANEKLVFDRPTVLARLVASGLTPDQVHLTGADTVTVECAGSTAAIDLLLKAAREFIEKTRGGPEGCAWQLIKEPTDLLLPDCEDLTFKPSLAKGSQVNQLNLEVSVCRGEKELTVVEMRFKPVYPVRQAVAAQDIAAGAQLTSENVTIQTVVQEQKPAMEWVSPIGMVAARTIPAGNVIRPGMFKTRKAETIVRRDQGVTMRIQGIGFTVSTVGKAMEDGKAGDMIKVRNIDSQRVVLARVAADGTVEPLLNEVKK